MTSRATPSSAPRERESSAVTVAWLRRLPGTRFALSDVDDYGELFESVRLHALEASIEAGRLLPAPEAAGRWYESVYLPGVAITRETVGDLLDSCTDADVFLAFHRQARGYWGSECDAAECAADQVLATTRRAAARDRSPIGVVLGLAGRRQAPAPVLLPSLIRTSRPDSLDSAGPGACGEPGARRLRGRRPPERRSAHAVPPSSPTGAPPVGTATQSPSPSPSPPTSDALQAAIEVADIREHLDHPGESPMRMAAIAPLERVGFDASAEYVAEQLTDAGYAVERQDFAVGTQPSMNLIIERIGSSEEVVMLGAHLDSVVAGPGLNDNGTGVATLLVLAERLAESPEP